MSKTRFLLSFVFFSLALIHASPSLLINSSPGQWSAPFEVLDQPKGVYGEYHRADVAFHNAAARVALRFHDDKLEVKFRCPIPTGMKLNIDSALSCLKGEYVEFFFSPSPDSFPYFYYAVNVNGKKMAKKFRAVGVDVADWPSDFEAEVRTSPENYEIIMQIPYSRLEISGSEPGLLYRGNFTRCGDTGGGLSTWAPVGREFHSPPRFGQLISGSIQAWLQRRLRVEKKRFSTIKSTDVERHKTAARHLARLQENISSFNNEPGSLADLEKAFAQLSFDFARLEYRCDILAWEAAIWDNDFSFRPGTAPLEKISISVPANGQTYFGFALTNFSDTHYLGRIKWFSKYNPHSFNSSGNSPYGDRIKLFEMQELCNFNHMPVFDPLIPLPLGSVVRTPAQSTTPLLMCVNAVGWKPGTYTGQLAVKSSRPEFQTFLIPLEITVSIVDVSSYKPDIAYYSYTFHRWNNDKNHAMLKLYADHGANLVLFQFYTNAFPRVYPKIDKDGNADLNSIDMEQFDSVIDRALAAGFPKDHLKLVFDLGWPDNALRRDNKRPSLASDSELFEKAIGDTLHFWYGHWEKKYGIASDRIFLMPRDEADGDVDDPSSPIGQSLAFAKMLKKIDPAFRTWTNSLMMYKTAKGTVLKNMRAQAQYFDVFCPLRWNVPPETFDIWKGKELWSYLVLNNATSPLVYRRMLWLNFRDGMSPVTPFWHMEEQAGGDGFDFFIGWANGIRSNYAAVYTDITHGTILTSRRLEAHSLGLQDYKLMEFCRQKLAERPNPEISQQFKAIVNETASANNMAAFEAGRKKLETLAECLALRPAQ